MSDIRIGISGWRYAPWRKSFYPKGLRQKDELHFASRAVNSIEINGSFYGLQRPTSYARWYADTPDNFIFSVKASRHITHEKRLRDIEQPLANFFASGMFHLKEKLGPFLWQFPPSFTFDETLFEEFLAQLPMLIVRFLFIAMPIGKLLDCSEYTPIMPRVPALANPLIAHSSA